MQTFELEPERLREAYDGDFRAAPFTVEDVLAGGRRRRNRRAAGLAGGGLAAMVATAVVVTIGSTALTGPDRKELTPVVTTTTTAAPAAYPGCVDEPTSCLTVVSDWSRDVARSTATVTRTNSDGYEAGAVVLQQQVSTVPRQQDIYLSVVIAPTTTKAVGQAQGPEGPHEVVLEGFSEPVHELTSVGGGNFVETWDLKAVNGAHPAVQVAVNVANQGPAGGSFDEATDDVAAPSWWTEDSVADLLRRLVGSGPDPQSAGAPSSTSTGVPSAKGDCTPDPVTCTAAFFAWADKYQLWLGNKGETTDGSSGPGARLFTAEPDPAGDNPGVATLVVSPTTPKDATAGMKPVTIAGLQAWTSTTTHADHTTRSIVVTATAGDRGGIALDLAVASGQVAPPAWSEEGVADLVRRLYGLG